MKGGSGRNTFSLIYEFNNDSCLFARMAALEIENKNYNSAIEILEKGIKKFPFYPTANFIYAIALAYNGKSYEAVSRIESVKDYFKNNETIEFYLEKVRQISKDQNSLKESSRFSFVPGSFNNSGMQFEDRLGIIAEELSHAKINVKDPVVGSISPVEEKVPEKRIVSETMAYILAGQGNFTEAIMMLEELAFLNPERKGYFLGKINEIKMKQGF